MIQPRRPGVAPPSILLALALLLARAASAQDVRLQPGTLEDRRTSGKFFAGLELEMSLLGDGLDGVRAYRALVAKAVDDQGTNLLPDEKREPDFEKPFGGTPKVKVKLKNPSRKATAITEVSGTLELYFPAKDPASVANVDRFTSKMDKPIASPALKSAKIEARVVSPQAMKAERKKAEAEMEKKKAELKEEAKKRGEDPAQVDALLGLVAAFGGMMGDAGENDVVLKLTDPESRLFDVKVFAKSGEEISTQGSMSSNDTRILHFSEKLPADAVLRFFLKTKKALVTQPFSLKEVLLP